MVSKISSLKWELYNKKKKILTLFGLKNGHVLPYGDELIKKLRNVYYGGVPASIILLSNAMSNGFCYDRALLMSQAFLDSNDDVNLIYASIDGIRLNPKYAGSDMEDLMYADHCIVERITQDGKSYIYDTSSGFIYEKWFYWLIERPKVRKVNNKEKISEFINNDLGLISYENDRYVARIILSFIEDTYGKPTEMYSQIGIELLQREIKNYKEKLNDDDMVLKDNTNIRTRSK